MSNDIKHYLELVTTNKYGGSYSVKYVSPIDGKQKRIPVRYTGRLGTREAADAWIEAHLSQVLTREIELAKRQQWRHATEVVKLASQYRAYKQRQAPKSWQQEVSVLEGFVLPYFVVEAGLLDPNAWHPEHQRFKSWLLEGAFTEKGGNISVSTANKSINALNKFSEWMRDQVRALEWGNCRPLKCYPISMQNSKGADDLVDEDEYRLVVEKLVHTGNTMCSEMFQLQRHTGMRVNELLGLSLLSVTASIPEEIREAFTTIGIRELFGAIYLDSQPRDPYITVIDGEIPRKALKWRKDISPKNARTIPIHDKKIWNAVVARYKAQKEAYALGHRGPKKDSYRLFEDSQRNTYLSTLREAYSAIGLRFKGSHCLRHTRATELTGLYLPNKIQEVVLGHKGAAQERYHHIVEILNKRTQQDKDLAEIDFAE